MSIRQETRQSGTTAQQGLGTPGEAKSSSKFHGAFLTRTLSLAADGIIQGLQKRQFLRVRSHLSWASVASLAHSSFRLCGTGGGSASPICTLSSVASTDETVRQDIGDGARAVSGPALSSGTPATVTPLLGLRTSSLDGRLRGERRTIPRENHSPHKKRMGLRGEGETVGIGHPAMSLWASA